MRTFELVNCLLLAVFATGVLLGGRPAQWGMRILCAVLVATLLVHVIDEGAHWQMAPAYLAEAVLLAWFFMAGRLPAASSRWLSAGCLLLIIATAVLSSLLPMFRLPKPTGQYAVGTRLLYMVDPSREDEFGFSPSGHRELMVQVWYPAQLSQSDRLAVYRRRSEATRVSSYQSVLKTHSFLDAEVLRAGAPFPLLIFNPAWTGQRTQNTFLMEELASHGFVVASIDHTYYSGAVAFPDGREMDSRHAPEMGSFAQNTVDEEETMGAKFVRILAKDDSFVLDQLQAMNQDAASPFFQRLDMARVGALGHSIGGAAAAQAALDDPRIKAALNLDGWMFGDVAEQGLSKPLMLMYEGTYDEKQMPPFPASGSEGNKRFWQMNRRDIDSIDASLRRYGGYRLFLRGASHWNFTDRALYSPLRRWTEAGTIKPHLAHSIIDRYTLAFFSHVLKGTPEPILDGPSGVSPEATLETWVPHP
jgi:dienelactone hydrolase